MILNTKPQSVVQQGTNKIVGHVFMYKQEGGNMNICFYKFSYWKI